MKTIIRYFLAAAVLLVAQRVSAQVNFTVNTSSIQFNPTNELSKDSFMVVVNAPVGGWFMNYLDLRVFPGIYGDSAFSLSKRRLNFTSTPTDSFKVYFSPKHNVTYNSKLVLYQSKQSWGIGALTINLQGQGKYSLSYYNATENLEETALRSQLKTIISTGTSSLGYDDARDEMYMRIDNRRLNGQGASTNTIECVYTGRLETGYTSRSDLQSSGNFNCEHTFPQGFFNQNEPMRSDMHHLFPTDETANNSRGNREFGVATMPYQSTSINAPSLLGNNGLYEPRDAQKGRTARAMMYFVLRFQDYSNHFSSQQTILRQWHKQFAPDAAEKRRTADIFAAQRNRNPFVDYPQFNDRISNLLGTTTAPDKYRLWFNVSEFISLGVRSGNLPGTEVNNFTIVNYGNKSITINSLTTADTSLFKVMTPTPFTIAPGGEASVDVRYLLMLGGNTTNIQASTNIPGGNSLSIPFAFLVPGGIDDEISFNSPYLEVNTGNELQVNTGSLEGKNTEWEITNLLGRKVYNRNVTNTQLQERLDLYSLKNGIYLLSIKYGSYQKSFKIAKLD